MQNIDYHKINLIDGFWNDIFNLNANISINSVAKRFDDSRFEALRFTYKDGDENKPHIFYDSDTAKWIEGAANILYYKRKEYSHLEKQCDELISLMVKHQQKDGYFNSYFQQVEPDKIFTDRDCHELYCLGHIIEAAIAYDIATDKKDLLNLAFKYVDYVIDRFTKKKDVPFLTPGHEEIELALLHLYKYTGKRKYYTLAKFFLDNRGNNTIDYDKDKSWYSEYGAQDHKPIREMDSAEGHSVRACYLYIAMSRYAKESKDKELKEALHKIYESIKRRIYITGGIGSTRHGEAFTIDYDLPNESAYCESCASIALMLFLNDLYQLDGNKEYHDIIERIMYNSLLSSTSLDGKSFFYENPLEINLKEINKEIGIQQKSRPKHPITQRVELFDCSCCPPNINRTFSSMTRYILSTSKNNLFINQFISSSCQIDNYSLTIKSSFPSEFKVEIQTDYKGILNIRIPSWAKEYIVSSTTKKLKNSKGYLRFECTGNKVTIHVEFKTKPTFVYANKNVYADAGRVALVYGPVVYCLEGVDNGSNLNAISVVTSSVRIGNKIDFCPFNYLEVDGYRVINSKELYTDKLKEEKGIYRHIPYYTFANRGSSDMLVWVRKH